MKRIRTLQLARTGIHGTQSAQLTKQDFAEMIETFTQSPVYLGHESAHKDYEPSWGKVIELNLSDDGETLYGDVVLEPEVDKLFSDKKYNGWSIGCPRRKIDNKRVLHHLALLGSTKPAIPNLRQVKVSQSEYAEEISAAEYKFSGEMPEFKDNYQEEIPMTDEEKKKMEALEAENKKLKEDAEKAAASQKAGEDKKEKFSDSQEYADMQKKISDLEASRKEAVVKGVCDRFADVPAGLKDNVRKVAGILASNTDSFEFS
ncbi:MAG: hypothetical protein IKO39_00375, partial [Treponema sp.]|nr:hypothetical protein [Treponema sp.]